LAKNGGFGFWAQNMGRGGAMLTPPLTNSFAFGGCDLCATSDENRSRNATVRVHKDRQTDTRTDRDKIYNLSHAICYSYDVDNKVTVY